METLQALFAWLDGKKTYIFSIIALTISFLGIKGLLDKDTIAYLISLLSIIAGGAEYTTVKLGARK